jgi:hypothetical protein
MKRKIIQYIVWKHLMIIKKNLKNNFIDTNSTLGNTYLKIFFR